MANQGQFLKQSRIDQSLLIGLGIILALRIINGILLPPTQDEAYYFYWSKFVDWGYFDHPPMVAWVSSLHNVTPSSIWLARAGTMFLGLLSIPLLRNFFRKTVSFDNQSLFSALILATASLVAFLQGFITTPDIPLAFCWIAALHEAAAALDARPRRWLTAGLFTGLGILSKFTMLMIGPVFLIALLFHPKNSSSLGPTSVALFVFWCCFPISFGKRSIIGSL